MSLFGKFVAMLEAREERLANRRATRKSADDYYQSFLDESSETAPFAPKNPGASLYRHAWRRSEVIRQMARRSNKPEAADLAQRYERLAERAGKDYDRVAPSNAYGKVRLELSAKQGAVIWAKELERLNPEPASVRGETASIYMGICSRTRRVYIGQTLGAPEQRWAQHRRDRTGPFKKGAIDPSYSILEIPVVPERLNEREAYFIGFYDSYANGLNDTVGNDRRAYEKGRSDRQSRATEIPE